MNRAFTIFGDELLGLLGGAFAIGVILTDVMRRPPRVMMVEVESPPPKVEPAPEPAKAT